MILAKLSGLLLACLLPLAQSAPASESSPSGFDYVIVGGGTAGLVIANRLTENPGVTVAVIEPGGDTRNNTNVTDPAAFTLAYGTYVDWAYQMVPKVYNGESRALTWHAGKALGGTTTINGMTYIRAQIAQIDAWETIGNKGWNWANLWPYYLKQETFQPPTKAQAEAGAAYNPAYHGTKGPLSVGWEYGLVNGSMHTIHNQTWQKLGYKYNPDVNGGNELGFSVWPRMVNRASNTRSDAASAYLWPFQRPNLHIIQGFVNRVTWSNNSVNGLPTASGVEYTSSSSQKTSLIAKKEVILSAGAMKSPAILELSGVGNPQILKRFGIKTVVNNTGVGEHLQDQPNTALIYQSPNATANGTMPYVTYARSSEIFGSDTSKVASQTNASIPTWAQQASARSNDSVSAAAFERLFRQQWDLLFNQNIPAGEMLNSKYAGNLITALWNLITFSRGSVHIGSADPTATPLIDLDYFAVDHDLNVQVKMAQQVRKFYGLQPVKSVVGKEVVPGFKKVQPDAPDAQWRAWAQGRFQPNYHAVGTAAMLPRKLGGVVDSSLKVYGTSNLRVIDASVLPSQVSGHLTANIYAIAERAADIIKGKV